jgi:hypothetical protein
LFQQTVTAIVDGMLTSAWPMNSGWNPKLIHYMWMDFET